MKKRKVEFTHDSVRIYDMQTNLKIASRKVNDQPCLYTFYDFVLTYSKALCESSFSVSDDTHMKKKGKWNLPMIL